MSKEDVDKRVRNLTKLTKEHSVANLKADFFDSVHPLAEVYIATYIFVKLSLVSSCIYPLHLYSANLLIRRVINSLFLILLFRRQGPYQMTLLLLRLKPLRLTKVRTKMISKNRRTRLAHRHRFLPHLLMRLVSTRKGSMSMKMLPRVPRRMVKPPLL
jgi:hypothetical protein